LRKGLVPGGPTDSDRHGPSLELLAPGRPIRGGVEAQGGCSHGGHCSARARPIRGKPEAPGPGPPPQWPHWHTIWA
jgi:hypothetical protein